MTIARGFRSCAWHLFVTLDELVAELCEGGMQEVALRVPIVGAVDAGSPEHLMALALVVIEMNPGVFNVGTLTLHS